jgi:sugar/nucleoside kinase (ribokinase family)
MMKRDSTADLRLALHDVDIFLTSEKQCRELFRPEHPNIWEMAEKLAAMGPNTVVLKRGEHGQAVLDNVKKRRLFVPAYPTRPVDITGAGHTYSGAFAVTFATTDSDVQLAAASASAAASMAVEGVGYSYAIDSTPGLINARRDRIIEGIHHA